MTAHNMDTHYEIFGKADADGVVQARELVRWKRLAQCSMVIAALAIAVCASALATSAPGTPGQALLMHPQMQSPPSALQLQEHQEQQQQCVAAPPAQDGARWRHADPAAAVSGHLLDVCRGRHTGALVSAARCRTGLAQALSVPEAQRAGVRDRGARRVSRAARRVPLRRRRDPHRHEHPGWRIHRPLQPPIALQHVRGAAAPAGSRDLPPARRHRCRRAPTLRARLLTPPPSHPPRPRAPLHAPHASRSQLPWSVCPYTPGAGRDRESACARRRASPLRFHVCGVATHYERLTSSPAPRPHARPLDAPRQRRPSPPAAATRDALSCDPSEAAEQPRVPVAARTPGSMLHPVGREMNTMAGEFTTSPSCPSARGPRRHRVGYNASS